MATFSGVPASADALLAPFFGVEAPDVWHACRQSWREVLSLAREGRTQLAQACFDFLPTRAALDLAGWPEVDIFAHT